MAQASARAGGAGLRARPEHAGLDAGRSGDPIHLHHPDRRRRSTRPRPGNRRQRGIRRLHDRGAAAEGEVAATTVGAPVENGDEVVTLRGESHDVGGMVQSSVQGPDDVSVGLAVAVAGPVERAIGAHRPPTSRGSRCGERRARDPPAPGARRARAVPRPRAPPSWRRGVPARAARGRRPPVPSPTTIGGQPTLSWPPRRIYRRCPTPDRALGAQDCRR